MYKFLQISQIMVYYGCQEKGLPLSAERVRSTRNRGSPFSDNRNKEGKGMQDSRFPSEAKCPPGSALDGQFGTHYGERLSDFMRIFHKIRKSEPIMGEEPSRPHLPDDGTSP